MDPSAYRTEVFSTWESYPAQSWLETFSLSGLQAPTKLGELLVREGEQLYATRFAGDRAYVVTFRRTDPLILVDLSNPAQPTIRGELQVPGYSTDLLPLSNSRLLAMGLENGQPTVSLFDSSDVTRPSLLSKVLLSTTNGWSYSEANTDEKAFSYFPESGLILFPWQGWTNGVSFQTVQLLDLRQDVLTRRGVIPQATIARRATVIGQRVYSISASELLSIDVADRDRPDLRATLPLLYPVEQVFVLGNRLVEIAEEVGFDAASTRPMIKLALQTSPEVPTGTLALPAGLRSLGFFLHGTQLHVLQQDAPTYRLELTLVTNELQQPVSSPATTGLLSEGLMGVTYGSQPSSDGQTAFQVVTNAQYIAVPGPLVASIIDCSGPSPRILGQTRREGISISFASQLTALVVAPDILVWTDVRSTWAGSWGPPVPAPLPMGMGGAANPTGVFPGPMVRWADGAWTAGSWGRWGGTSGAHFLPINFSTETRPQMGNLISVGTNSSWTVTSGAFAADGQIFFSHETTKYFPSPQLDTHAEWAAVTPALFTGWETRHQLEVVNLSDPADPVFRDPLDLPGPLMGLSHFGALLYTRGSATSGSESGHQLQALAYDGLKVSLVDEIGLAGVIAFSLRTDGVALVAQSGTTNRPAMIASWAVASDGHWQAYAEVPLVGRPAISLHAYSDGLVVAERGGGEFLFLKSNARDSLLPLGIFEGDCGLFPDWSKADATIPAGLWLPRGPYGLWPIWGQSVPNPP